MWGAQHVPADKNKDRTSGSPGKLGVEDRVICLYCMAWFPLTIRLILGWLVNGP